MGTKAWVFLASSALVCAASFAGERGPRFVPGDGVEGVVSPVDDTDPYQFEGVAGMRLWVTVSRVGREGQAPRLVLLSPSGVVQEVAVPARSGRVAHLRGVLLSSEGRHEIRLVGESPSSYLMTTRAVLPRTVVAPEDPVPPGGELRVPFPGVEGMTAKVAVRLRGGVPGDPVLIGPDGSPVPDAVTGVRFRRDEVLARIAVPGPAGTYEVAVPNHGSLASWAEALVRPDPMRGRGTTLEFGAVEPRPSAAFPGEAVPGTPISITGTGFLEGARVLFDGVEAATTFVSATALSAPLVAAPGPVAIEVVNPDGQSNALSGALTAIVPPPAAIPPEVDNLVDGEALPFDLALVKGTADPSASWMTVSGGGGASWPVVDGRFKALVPLAAGDNSFTLTAAGASATFHLAYAPPGNPRFVRLVYLVASDSDGSFDGLPGEPNTQESAVARIRLAGRLLQTATAEKLFEQGLGRRTFLLDRDAGGEPVVEVFRSSLTTSQARSMTGNALWSWFYGELGSLPRRADSIDVAFLGMTHWDAASGTVSAHTALGGGRLALFGTGTLHAWPESLGDVLAAWSDATPIDTSVVFDDSGGRGRYWANYATGLGATLHELGHCLGLPHPASRQGIMWRGFDQMNRTFMMSEPASSTSSGIAEIQPAQELANWNRSDAVRLRYHRWLEPEDRAYTVDTPPSISWTASSVSLYSAAGIRLVLHVVGGNGSGHEEFLGVPPTSRSIEIATLRSLYPGASSIELIVTDDQGNTAQATIPL